MEPSSRRGLLGAGAAAAIGLSAAPYTAPVAAREVDPAFPEHCARLLDVLGRHDAAFGPHDVLVVARHQLGIIAQHRELSRGELHTELLRIEARWTEFAAFLCNDTGDTPHRDGYTERALRLAQASHDQDVVALARMRQAQWAVQQLDARRAVEFAEAALRVPDTSADTRARCALRAAHGHALAGNTLACQRRLADAAANGSASGCSGAVTPNSVPANEARCWLWMRPSKAITLYDDALRKWPRDQVRDGGLHQARLALACAAAGELDRAEAEGRKALAMQRATKSGIAARELLRLRQTLSAA